MEKIKFKILRKNVQSCLGFILQCSRIYACNHYVDRDRDCDYKGV